ncbi:MAG: nucleotide sugar dehydrogenase [Actinomycetota bacterium]|nr:nucleotide sugar dehydrogenase [Actinomycetota bacterium]
MSEQTDRPDLLDVVDRIRRHEPRVAVIGQGYVGLPLAVRAVAVGYDVVGYELSPTRVEALLAGTSYVGDVTDSELAAALAAGYRPTADAEDLAGFDIAVVSVPTPLADGGPDLSHIEAAAGELGAHLRPGACVILESTTYPGTTTELMVPILAERSGLEAGRDFYVGYSPERIDPGNDRFGLVNTPKVVSGIDDASLLVVDEFFRTLVDTTVPVGNTAEAELVKLLENTFRHVNIALVNELAVFARDLGVDVWRAISAASTKPYGFMPFTPGPGVGGHCLPIDPTYLAWEVKRRTGRSFRFVELANEVNRSMPSYVVERLEALLERRGRPLTGSSVLLLGLAYKRATSDWRESPSVVVADLLAGRGADVTFSDPYVHGVNASTVTYPMVEWSPSILGDHDAVVLLVDHPEFEPALLSQSPAVLLDTKGITRGLTFDGEVL